MLRCIFVSQEYAQMLMTLTIETISPAKLLLVAQCYQYHKLCNSTEDTQSRSFNTMLAGGHLKG